MTEQEIFLRGVWKMIPDEEKTDWVEQIAEYKLDKTEPLGDYGSLIKSMLDKGVTASEIARLCKIIGYESVFSVLYHLEDPTASFEDFDESEETLHWGLYSIDPETEKPKEGIWSLHEYFLSMDPSGREMRPKDNDE
ncbi:hypothetical protein KMW28_15970 [Flammeovirga yaeyamensis]|uniref:Uncharacterized protein n=1 Tax=Flammeovirga yaeyamensis TaxID=367791 RepID=A0AAX1N1D4_9BACT|nr:hypothetical protein [Flammeovirga yaeyamensis]MBB3698494.1 hypothetical protein [Flammeovirga yaeyamensis]NMF34157.1 hypothetical protein [Flammeovirga yaeyamensis]QWG01142.1 hypothetical protein KMW28_15970 [Flammeovirga yaeyamensis]